MRIASGCGKAVRRHRRAVTHGAETACDQIDLFQFTPKPIDFPNPLSFQLLPVDAINALKLILTNRDLLSPGITQEPIQVCEQSGDEWLRTHQVLRITVFRLCHGDLPTFVPIESYSFMHDQSQSNSSNIFSIVHESAFVELLNEFDSYRHMDRAILITWGSGTPQPRLCWKRLVADGNVSELITDHFSLKHYHIHGAISLSTKVSPSLKIKMHFTPAPHKGLMNLQLQTRQEISTLQIQCVSQHIIDDDDDTTLTDSGIGWIESRPGPRVSPQRRKQNIVKGELTTSPLVALGKVSIISPQAQDLREFAKLPVSLQITPIRESKTLCTLDDDFESRYCGLPKRDKIQKLLFNKVRKVFLDRPSGLTRRQIERIFNQFKKAKVNEAINKLLLNKMVTCTPAGLIRHRIHNKYPAPRCLRRLRLPAI